MDYDRYSGEYVRICEFVRGGAICKGYIYGVTRGWVLKLVGIFNG